MSAYTCLKPATFAGTKYMPGDQVPAEAIPAGRVEAVLRLGLIAVSGATTPTIPESQPSNMEPTKVSVPVTLDDGTDDTIEVLPESITAALSVMQLNVEDGTKAIENMDDQDALIVLHACDSRAGIKKAAIARARSIQEDLELAATENESGAALEDGTDGGEPGAE